MGQKRTIGKVESLRIHREIGYGAAGDHIPVHAVVRLNDESDRELGFPLTDDERAHVHQAWVGMLRDAFTHGYTVSIVADHDTEGGQRGVIREITLAG